MKIILSDYALYRFFLLASCVIVLLAGCAGYSSKNIGKTAQDTHVLPLTATGPEPHEWQAKHLSVEYIIQKVGNSFMLSGSLTMSDWIYYSFPYPQFFYFNINYLNENNRVVSSHEISPLIRLRAQFQSTYALPTPPPAPPGAVSFVFSYWGNFQSSGRFRDDDEQGGADDWEIYFNPFD